MAQVAHAAPRGVVVARWSHTLPPRHRPVGMAWMLRPSTGRPGTAFISQGGRVPPVPTGRPRAHNTATARARGPGVSVCRGPRARDGGV